MKKILLKYLSYYLMILSLTNLLITIVYSQNISFELKDVSTMNSAGYSEVYPGSRGATVNIYLLYTGSQGLSSVTGCLYSIPQVITPRVKCSPARDLKNSVVSIVRSNDMIYFTYIIDVSSDAAPSVYALGLNISYRSVSSGQLGFYTTSFSIKISPYPRPNIYVVDSYLSPNAYAGTSNTNIYVVLENRGDSDLDSGEAVIQYPPGFISQSNRIQIGALPRNSRSTIMISGVGISPQVAPGEYYVILYVNASMRTTDGVSYTAYITLDAEISVLEPPIVNIELIRSQWVSPKISIDSIGAAYRVVFRNKDLATINSIVARLILPQCMTSENGSRVIYSEINRVISQGEIFEIDFGGIRVSRDCLFDTYYTADLVLSIYGSLKGSEFYSVNLYKVPMIIPNQSIDLRIDNVYWEINPVYPGSINNHLIIELVNRDYMDLESITAQIRSYVLYPEENYYTLNTLGSGSKTQLVFTESVKTNTKPGVYTAELRLTYIVSSGSLSYMASSRYSFSIVINDPPKPILEILSYRWIYDDVYKSSIGNQLEILIRNRDVINIRSLQITLRTPENILVHGSREYVIEGGSLSAGSVNSYVFDGIDIYVNKSGRYPFEITLEGYGGDQGREFWFNLSYIIYSEIKDPSDKIVLVDYGWSQVVAYENTSRASIYVTLRSFLKQSIFSIVAELKLLNAETSQNKREVISTYTGTVNYGDIIRLVFGDIEVRNKSLEAIMNINAVAGSGSMRFNLSVSKMIVLETSRENVLDVSYIYSYYQNNPAPILPTAKGVVIRVGMINTRPEALSSVVVNITTPPIISVRSIGGTCLSGVAGGGQCYIDLYVDVDASAKPGIYMISLSTRIFKPVSNSLTSLDQLFTLPIEIEDPAKYSGEPATASIYWGTTSPQPVFMNSRYAPLTLKVVNIGRYVVTGLQVGVSSKDLSPIKDRDVCATNLAPGAACTVTLYFDVRGLGENITIYVNMIYYVSQYGAYIEFNKTEIYLLRIERLNSTETLQGSVEFVTSYWMEGSVDPWSFGNHLVIVFRNNYVNQMRGAYLILELPNGMRYAYDNSSVAKIPPTLVTSYINPLAITTQQLQELYRYLQTTATTQSIQKGDFIVFIAPINIYNVSIGIYSAKAVLIYTDEIGVLRNFETQITIPVLGSSKYINVSFPEPLVINQSYIDTKMLVTNVGSSPIYNVYILIYPYSTAPLVIASPSVTYLDKIDPGETKELLIKIAYNPYVTYQTSILYGTSPLMISVIYRDPSGTQRIYNTTYAVIVQPFIKIIARDTSVVYISGEGVRVSGTLINLGSATAQRVEVSACAENICKSSFVGDMDPGTQTAFRIEIPVNQLRNYTLNLYITYYNIYNVQETITATYKIHRIETTATLTTPQGLIAELDIYKIIVSAIVITAVLVALYMIYRSVSKTQKTSKQV